MEQAEGLPPSLLSYLACPLCKGNLKSTVANQVKCLSCGAVYPMDDGIPILLPPQLEEFKILEAECHSKDAESYAERVHKFSYRVSRYQEDYLTCFRDYQKGAVVLEVGGGGGIEACQLKDMGLTVIESDIAIGMVKRARRRATDNGQNAHSVFVVCDAELLPCRDQSLDGILIVAALHHLPSPERFFAAAKRALKPGGLLVIGFEPNRWPYYTVIPVLRFLRRMLHPNRIINPGDTSIADKETTGFSEADFARFLKEEGLIKVSLQRIWYLGAFVHFFVQYINNKRPVERMIDLPIALQRALVSFDDILSRIVLLRRFCWHWTLVSQRPNTNDDI